MTASMEHFSGTKSNSTAYAADGVSTAVFDPIDIASVGTAARDGGGKAAKAAVKRRRIWPWIIAAVVVLLGAFAGGSVWFFQSHALPGVTLWGTSMAGKSHDAIVAEIDAAVDNAAVPVTYNGKTENITLKDMGLGVDSESIATEIMQAKRGDGFFSQYAFWTSTTVSPELSSAKAADVTTLNSKLGITESAPVDAKVQINEAKDGFNVIQGAKGEGVDASDIVASAEASVRTLGADKPKAVTVTLKQIDPAITDDIASQAKTTLDTLAKNPVTIKIADKVVAKLDAPALAAVSTVEADQKAPLKSTQSRNGYVVFDSDKVQQYYDENIKTTFKAERKDSSVILNNNGEVIQTVAEGHDGITVTAGGDSSVGTQAIAAFSKGEGSVNVQGTVDPMKQKAVKRHVVVDLSDRKVYAYEDGKLIRTLNMIAASGNDEKTGECDGTMCTPTGDFDVWLKYESQDMSGNLTLSNGKVETWNVANVGFVNYFSHGGCAIHRIASSTPVNDADLVNTPNGSHGCVGIGWDVAEWFYKWAVMGTSVHVQQ